MRGLSDRRLIAEYRGTSLLTFAAIVFAAALAAAAVLLFVWFRHKYSAPGQIILGVVSLIGLATTLPFLIATAENATRKLTLEVQDEHIAVAFDNLGIRIHEEGRVTDAQLTVHSVKLSPRVARLWCATLEFNSLKIHVHWSDKYADCVKVARDIADKTGIKLIGPAARFGSTSDPQPIS